MNPKGRAFCANIEDMERTEQDPYIVDRYPTIYAETDDVDRCDVASVFEEEDEDAVED